jgi:cathepsin L
MLRLVIVLSVLLVAFGERVRPQVEDPDTVLFKTWMTSYGRQYQDEVEFQHRFQIFKRNNERVQIHNSKEPRPSYTLALNKFADLSHEEFKEIYLGFGNKGKTSHTLSRTSVVNSPRNDSIPTNWDWRTKNAVSEVKNQGQCGSCWSFSTTGSTEGCHALKTGNLVSLSEQNLMDCSTSYGNEGCDGGLMSLAFEYIINNKGVDTESSYPYEGEDDTCRFKASNVGATLTGYMNVTSGDENDLLSKANIGPVSVAIDASSEDFQLYDGGVYVDYECSNDVGSLDHGVLVVGWGFEKGWIEDTYWWIVKNSWGEDWGESGYILMTRNWDNMCGIATEASLPQC